ncbi:MAG: DNA-3-methyladenine glycosylase family protein [Ferrimicrobium sp.]
MSALEDALDRLVCRDPLIAEFRDRHGVPLLARSTFDPGRGGAVKGLDAFGFLVETVVYQQLSGASARSIWSRLVTALADTGGLTPEGLGELDDVRLREVGLSAPKIRTIRALIGDLLNEKVSLEDLQWHPDEVVRSRIEGLHGFGPWSVDMFLIFHLQRLDVWPVGDLAMRRSLARHLHPDGALSILEAQALGDRFSPYRTIAAWYFWADDHQRIGNTF